ncbi:molybdenum cofactor cytidylyltransferase [Caloramator quimbayensis]|uniref:Molybdenum cofactor cytidylyltransferase n=1 Tax=Caloramator quimbayensis TaxID=1147123 RepID=A0A1T4Y7R5_9CLOT|nr:nucleotidyltransferase family protein [Caloramator quimbayensis]SKA97723.1 molybdenum cofactor cytidylyltransferase [Caloramator quimbayensis]
MKVEGIILAAGFSKRANAFKMTLNYKGKTIIENVIDGMLPYVERITVVGGYKIENLEPVIKKYEKVQLIFNEKYEEGMFSSIKKGISTVKGEGFFLTPGDYPLIEGFVYEKLLSIKGDIIIPVYNSKRGHPIFIKSSQIEKINDNKYSNLREFINDNNPSYAYVDCIGILKDVDTMEDYKEILKY